MYCTKCTSELTGELGITDSVQNGLRVIEILEISPRNHIICDSCNAAVCRGCAIYWKAGYCNECVDQYQLHNYCEAIIASLSGGHSMLPNP